MELTIGSELQLSRQLDTKAFKIKYVHLSFTDLAYSVFKLKSKQLMDIYIPMEILSSGYS